MRTLIIVALLLIGAPAHALIITGQGLVTVGNAVPLGSLASFVLELEDSGDGFALDLIGDGEPLGFDSATDVFGGGFTTRVVVRLPGETISVGITKRSDLDGGGQVVETFQCLFFADNFESVFDYRVEDTETGEFRALTAPLLIQTPTFAALRAFFSPVEVSEPGVLALLALGLGWIASRRMAPRPGTAS